MHGYMIPWEYPPNLLKGSRGNRYHSAGGCLLDQQGLEAPGLPRKPTTPFFHLFPARTYAAETEQSNSSKQSYDRGLSLRRAGRAARIGKARSWLANTVTRKPYTWRPSTLQHGRSCPSIPGGHQHHIRSMHAPLPQILQTIANA